MLGIGLAATRDIVSFFRYAAADAEGTPNPIAKIVRHAIGVGQSQSGNFLKTSSISGSTRISPGASSSTASCR